MEKRLQLDWDKKSLRLCEAIDLLRKTLDVLVVFENLHAKVPKRMRQLTDEILKFLDSYMKD